MTWRKASRRSSRRMRVDITHFKIILIIDSKHLVVFRLNLSFQKPYAPTKPTNKSPPYVSMLPTRTHTGSNFQEMRNEDKGNSYRPRGLSGTDTTKQHNHTLPNFQRSCIITWHDVWCVLVRWGEGKFRRVRLMRWREREKESENFPIFPSPTHMQRRSLYMRKKDVNMLNLVFRVRIPYLFLIYHIPLCIISGNRFYHGMKYLSFSSNRRTFQGHFPLSMLLSASFSRYIASHLPCTSALEWGKKLLWHKHCHTIILCILCT